MIFVNCVGAKYLKPQKPVSKGSCYIPLNKLPFIITAVNIRRVICNNFNNSSLK